VFGSCFRTLVVVLLQIPHPTPHPHVELSAFGAMNDVYNAVRQAVELLRDVHLALRASNVGAGAEDMFQILLDCVERSLVF